MLNLVGMKILKLISFSMKSILMWRKRYLTNLFEDHLDKSASTEKLYKNGTIWSNAPFGSIQLHPWLIFPNKEEFLDVLRDFRIQGGLD